MSATPPTVRTSARDQPWWNGALHVLTLSVLAVTQPLFDLLGRNASFFVAHRASGADIVTFGIVAFLLPTAILLFARFLIGLVSKSAAYVFHLSTLAVLGGLALGPPVVRAWGLHWVPALALTIAIGVVLVHLYRRFGGFRRFLSILGVATIVVPVLFLFTSGVKEIVLPHGTTAARIAGPAVGAHSDTPVMVVLFDELATTSLITPKGDVNAKRFPNFATLATRSTWYRDATTVGLRTDQAAPAILTGRRAPRRQVPSSYAYPNNLFTLLASTHSMHVHESVTQLCPPSLCHTAKGAEPTSGLASLYTDASVVLGHLVLPSDLAGKLLPPLGDRWAGFTRDARTGPNSTSGSADAVSSWLRAALLEAKQQHEGRMFDSFLHGVKIGKRPQLSWVHVQVPHPPWRYLPDGTTYLTGNDTPGYHSFTWGPNGYLVNEVLQRSLVQTRFADAMLGDLMSYLKQTKQWDDMLLIVLADHGATWAPNATRRDVDGKQRASLLGVPLFVKYPHEHGGHVDDANAEMIDVLPTIADVAGVRVPWETQGTSLVRHHPRPEKVVFDGKHDRTVRYAFADAKRRAAEIERLFGPGGGRDDLYSFGRDRAMVGERIRDVDVSRTPSRARVRLDDADDLDEVSTEGAFLPALVRGRVTGGIGSGRRIAVSLNGTIAGVGETYTDGAGTQLCVLLSPRMFRDGRNDVRVYLIGDDDRLVALRT